MPFTNAGTTNSQKDGQLIRPVSRKYDYGGTIGGPIRIPKAYNGRDESFFFVNFERYQQTQGFTNVETVPTSAYQQGNFSSTALFPLSSQGFGGPPTLDALGRIMLLDEVYDPNTTRMVNGATVRDPLPNGVIPLSRLDPVALAVQNYIPLPNAPGALNNYDEPSYTDYQHTTNWSFRLDHSFSSTIKISGYLPAAAQRLFRTAPFIPATLSPWMASALNSATCCRRIPTRYLADAHHRRTASQGPSPRRLHAAALLCPRRLHRGCAGSCGRRRGHQPD